MERFLITWDREYPDDVKDEKAKSLFKKFLVNKAIDIEKETAKQSAKVSDHRSSADFCSCKEVSSIADLSILAASLPSEELQGSINMLTFDDSKPAWKWLFQDGSTEEQYKTFQIVLNKILKSARLPKLGRTSILLFPELGDETERLHFHGIVWSETRLDLLEFFRWMKPNFKHTFGYTKSDTIFTNHPRWLKYCQKHAFELEGLKPLFLSNIIHHAEEIPPPENAFDSSEEDSQKSC